MKVVVVGANSFIARHFIEAAKGRFEVEAFSHERFLSGVNLDGSDVVVNFAIDPEFFVAPYDPQIDIDLKAARCAAAAEAHFVMLSSRKVYGPAAPMPVAENHPLAPGDAYGRNKARAEGEVRNVTGDRLTIVRGANVFGFEPGRRTFFGRAMTSLRDEGRIVLDESPFARRDFMAVEAFAGMLAEIVSQRPSGVYNLGSGHSVPIGRLALWLIEGYGSGELVIINPEVRDEFRLDITSLEQTLGVPVRRQALESYCRSLGKRLRNA